MLSQKLAGLQRKKAFPMILAEVRVSQPQHDGANKLQVRSRNDDLHSYRRSRSPSPQRPIRDNFRDNYNPYRDERRGMADRGFHRDRSLSPPGRERFSPVYGMQEDRQPTSRGRGDGDVDVLPIEKSLVGLIIGRAGENLRRVESSTGARVQFTDGPESGGPTRHCRISGSRQARQNAKNEIFRIVEENGNRGNERSRNQRPMQQETPVDEENSVQIMVPDRTVGLIIGRGGETIRDLQERSGCHVNIVAENKSISGLRPVNLIGSPQAQQRAKDLIMEVVESDTNGAPKAQESRRGRDNQQGNSGEKSNDRIMVPGEAVGMIIGKGGESIKEMQNNTGCKINVSPATGRDIEREIGLVGSRHAIELAKRAIMEKVEVVESRNRGDSTDRRDNPSFGNQYSPPSYDQAIPGQAPQAPPGGEDLYAAYGGYQNYLALWYAAMQQQQQGGQASGEQPGPPGTL